MLKRGSMVFKSVCLLAVISVALCLIPVGAHFFELANKMSLPTAEYMTTQKIYAGWSFFGVAIIAAIVFTLTHTLMVRAELHRAPPPWRHATDLLDVHLSDERCDQQLDNHAAGLRCSAATMGVFARDQRCDHLCGVC